jgi:hypothetical protein
MVVAFIPTCIIDVSAASSDLIELDNVGFGFGWSAVAGETWLFNGASTFLNLKGLVDPPSDSISGDAGSPQTNDCLILINSVGFSFGWASDIDDFYRPSDSLAAGASQGLNYLGLVLPASSAISGDGGIAQENTALVYANNIGFSFGWGSDISDIYRSSSSMLVGASQGLNNLALVLPASSAISGDGGSPQSNPALTYVNNVGFSYGWGIEVSDSYRPSDSMSSGVLQGLNHKASVEPPSSALSGDGGVGQDNLALIYVSNVGFSFGWGVSISDLYRTSTSMAVNPAIQLNNNGLKPGSGIGGFEIVATPEAREVQIGDSVTYNISVIPLDGFSSEVMLELSGVPSGSTYLFSPETIMPGETSFLTISTTMDTPLTTSTLTITGTSSEVTRTKTIELDSIMALEISLEDYFTKVDISKVHFEISITGSGTSYLAPEVKGEMSTSDAFTVYPGPLFIPFDTKPSFPLEIEVKVFSRDFFGSEVLVGTGVLTIASRYSLPATAEFNLPDIYFKLNVRMIAAERIPDRYFPDGTNELGTPYLLSEWYWYSVGADKIFTDFADSDFNDVTVAVLDTGIDYNHPALDDVIWINSGEIGLDGYGHDRKTNGIDDDGNGYIDDWHGWDSVFLNDNDPMDDGEEQPSGETVFHGTAVAGVLAAQAQTGFTAGVAAAMRGRIQIMPVRVLSSRHLLDFQPNQDIDIAEGIDYAVENGANVISMSLGQFGDYPSNVVQEAIQNAIAHGVVVVAAVGNEKSMGSFFPAAYEEVISVSGIRRIDNEYVGFWGEFEGGSNYGPGTTFANGNSVEISAPAERIWTVGKGSAFDVTDGTSMAAPIVSAAIAMMQGYASQRYGRTLTVDEVRQVLRDSSVDLGTEGWDPYYGFGLVNAFEALKQVDLLLGGRSAVLVVRGSNNGIYYRTYDSLGSSWSSWTGLSGSTPDSPAACVVGNELHFVVRGVNQGQIWHGYVNLDDNSFSGWTLLSGSTPSAPTLTGNSTHLCLVVRGNNNVIYYRFYNVATHVWSDWTGVPNGSTLSTPAAVLVDNELQVVVRGSNNNQIWHGTVDVGTGSFSGWTLLSGATPSPPTLTDNGTSLCLVVRGNNNVIYYRWYNLASKAWSGWTGFPYGSTPDVPAAAITGDSLQIVVRGMNNNQIWHGTLNLTNDAWSGWTLLDGATPSKPVLTS